MNMMISYQELVRTFLSASVQPWVWRDYHGASPHDKHFHLSVVPVKALYDYTLPWLFFKPQTWK